MNIIDFCEKHDIMWQPVKLVYTEDESGKIKKELDLNYCKKFGFQPKTNDMKVLNPKDIIKRQRHIEHFEDIAIYTDKVAQFDQDIEDNKQKEIINKDNAPYFLSVTKKLPHFFFKGPKKQTTVQQKVDGGDLLTGSWSYCKKDAIVENSDLELLEISKKSFKKEEKVKPKKKVSKIELMLLIEQLDKRIGPDCEYPMWFKIITGLFNVAVDNELEDPYQYPTKFSEKGSKYDDRAIETIKKLEHKDDGIGIGTLKQIISENTPIEFNGEELDSSLNINSQTELAQQLLKDNKDSIINTEAGYYLKNHQNVWISDEGEKNLILNSFIMRCQYYQIIKKVAYFYKDSIKLWEDIKKVMRTKIYELKYNRSFLNQLDNYPGHLFFNDGVLFLNEIKPGRFNSNIKKGEDWKGIFSNNEKVFKKYEDIDAQFFISNKIQWDYPVKSELKFMKEDIDKFEQFFIDGIFNRDIQHKEILNYMMQYIGGNRNLKYWLLMTGLRNSGKGVIIKALKSVFGEKIIGTLPSVGLEKRRGSSEDEAKQNSYLKTFVKSNIVFCSEIQPGNEFDGTKIKTAISGGEGHIEYRQTYGASCYGEPKAGLIIMANDFPAINPSDAWDNCLCYDMPCYFGLEPNSEYNPRIFRKADENIKVYMGTSQNFQKIFLHYLIDVYDPNTTFDLIKKEGQANREIADEGENDFKIINDTFEVTKNEDDFITLKDFKTILLGLNLQRSSTSVKKHLERRGANITSTKRIDNKKSKGIRFVKVIGETINTNVFNQLFET